jgi:hypothetical protein
MRRFAPSTSAPEPALIVAPVALVARSPLALLFERKDMCSHAFASVQLSGDLDGAILGAHILQMIFE